MKILIITNDLRALKVQRANIVTHALKQGHEVVICYGDGQEAENNFNHKSIQLHFVKMDMHHFRLMKDAQLIVRYKKLIAQIQPDIVHTMTIKPNLYAGLAQCLTGRASRPPHVATFPGLGKVFEPSSAWRNKIRQFVVTKALSLIAKVTKCHATFENKADAELFYTLNIFDKPQIHTLLGAGIDLEKYYPVTRPIKNAAKPIRVLFASRMLSTKGVFTFIEGACAVHAVNPNVEFLLVGDADKADRHRVDVVQELSRRGMGGQSWLRYLGRVPSDEMPDILRQADLVCLPSQLREGFPCVLIEAAATGAALLASDQPSIRQIVKAGENGWLIDPHNQKAFSNTLIEACEKPDRLTAFGAKSQQMVAMMRLGEEEIAQDFLAIYHHVIANA